MDQLLDELFDRPVEPSSHKRLASQAHQRIQSPDGASGVEPAIDPDPLAGDADQPGSECSQGVDQQQDLGLRCFVWLTPA